MKRTYECNKAGSYFINGKLKKLASGDTVVMNSREYAKFNAYFSLADGWNEVFNGEVVDTEAVTRHVLKFEREALYDYEPGTGGVTYVDESKKMKTIAFTIDTDTSGDTMPAGAKVGITVYNDAGIVVGENYEELAEFADLIDVVFLTQSYLNSGKTYEVWFETSVGNYEVVVSVEELNSVEIANIEVATADLDPATSELAVIFQCFDENGDTPGANVIEVGVADSSSGAPDDSGMVTDIEAIGAGMGVVKISDDADGQILAKVLVPAEGIAGAILTMDDAGTATYTELTFAVGIPSDGDTVVFGAMTFEFVDVIEDYDGNNIPISLVGISNVTDTAEALVEAFNAETPYDITADNTAGVVEFTANRFFTDYNDLATTADITATSTGVFEDATFGGGTGSSETGVDPDFFYLAFNYDGKYFISQRLPWNAL